MGYLLRQMKDSSCLRHLPLGQDEKNEKTVKQKRFSTERNAWHINTVFTQLDDVMGDDITMVFPECVSTKEMTWFRRGSRSQAVGLILTRK